MPKKTPESFNYLANDPEFVPDPEIEEFMEEEIAHAPKDPELLAQRLHNNTAASPSDAGGDIVQGGLRGQRQVSELVMLMRRAPQPILAAVHGAACGGGFALALAADVRIAGESARMNAAFIRIGLSEIPERSRLAEARNAGN